MELFSIRIQRTFQLVSTIPIGSFKKIPENSKTINLNIGMEVTFITL